MGCGMSSRKVSDHQSAVRWFNKHSDRADAFIIVGAIADATIVSASYDVADTDPLALLTLAAPRLKSITLRGPSTHMTGDKARDSKHDSPLASMALRATFLTKLHFVNYARLQDAAIAQCFAALPNPTAVISLSVQGCAMAGPATTKSFARFPQLQSLDVRGTNVAVESVMSQLRNLTELFADDTAVTFSLLYAFAKERSSCRLPSLRKLSLLDAPERFGPENLGVIFRHLALWADVERIDLRYADDRAIEALGMHAPLPHLTEINFERSTAITAEALVKLVKMCPRLQELQVPGCGLSGAVFEAILAANLPLKLLSTGPSDVSGEESLSCFAFFMTKYPGIDFRGDHSTRMWRVHQAAEDCRLARNAKDQVQASMRLAALLEEGKDAGAPLCDANVAFRDMIGEQTPAVVAALRRQHPQHPALPTSNGSAAPGRATERRSSGRAVGTPPRRSSPQRQRGPVGSPPRSR